eukprot:CAMPEP_0172657034 /NCGR_PEP_ID=MMETSP1074-20121228/1827_1 /TAXON_ID=2916 /ORGANISM="Ceratium fusus, Strain PA161109" /LENGTH=123 /DNA_ID=CAMNT_0013472053 /DNA_START=51 /DNA_END=420 /DNA_ORIENTATION=+
MAQNNEQNPSHVVQAEVIGVSAVPGQVEMQPGNQAGGVAMAPGQMVMPKIVLEQGFGQYAQTHVCQFCGAEGEQDVKMKFARERTWLASAYAALDVTVDAVSFHTLSTIARKNSIFAPAAVRW